MKERTYLAIDLKSFFASVECVERGLDPLTTNLVVADAARTEKTICLAVSPSLKAYGIPGRPRLFEVVQQVATVNVQRRQQAPGRQLTGKSFLAEELWKNPTLAVGRFVYGTDRLCLDRDAALTLQIHIVQHLILHLTLGQKACFLNNTVRKG